MESSIAAFLLRQLACELLPTTHLRFWQQSVRACYSARVPQRVVRLLYSASTTNARRAPHKDHARNTTSTM